MKIIILILFSAPAILLVVSLNANAATIHTFDVDTATDDLGYGPADPMVGVCPSDRWYVPYIGQGDLNISWSDDNGSTWNHSTIVSDGWKGETHMSVVCIQTWVNNTTCVMVRTEGADHAYDLYLFWLWGQDDPSEASAWNYTSFASGAGVVRFGSMIFNRTGTLYLTWNENNKVRYREWWVTNGSFGTDTLFISSNGYPMIQCDHNNDIWISYHQSATTGDLHTYSLDKSVHMTNTYQSTRVKWCSFFITGDNTKVHTGYLQYLTTQYKAVCYESVTNTTWGNNLFADNTNSWSIGYWAGGNCYGDKIVSIVMLRTQSGSDEYVEYKAEYDDADAAWESNETVLWTTPTSTDVGYRYGNSPCSVWPKINDISVNFLESGRMHYWIFKDELGATDNYYDILYFDAPTFHFWDFPTEPPNLPPEMSNETPSNESVGVSLTPWCNVTVIDPDNSTFDVTFEENSTGSWVVRQLNLTGTNGSFWWRFTQASSIATTYYWRVSADDGNTNVSVIFWFNTTTNNAPVGSSPFPSNGSSGISLLPTCRITVSDANSDPMNISWLENTTGTWVERHSDTGILDSTQTFRFPQFSTYLTTYYWRINLTDGTDNVTYIFHFTTLGNMAPTVAFPDPGNGSTGIDGSPTTSITVGDIDNVDIDWLEWTGSAWILAQRRTGVIAGTYSWDFDNATDKNGTYYWAVNATDGSLNTTRVYHFTVGTPTPEAPEEFDRFEVLDYGMFIVLFLLIVVIMIAGLKTIVGYFSGNDNI